MRGDKVQNDGYEDNGPEEVCVFRCVTAGAPGHGEEMGGVEAGAAALAIGVDVVLGEERMAMV